MTHASKPSFPFADPPFRHDLRGAVDAAMMEILSLFVDAQAREVSVSNLTDIIDIANEVVLWHLAALLRQQNRPPDRIGVFSREHPVRMYEVGRLLDRALQQADAEGVVWTPVLDTLAGSVAWTDAVEIRRRGNAPSIPTPEERLQLLVPWISNVRDPDSLRSLLRFRFPGVAAAVARHARVFDRDLLLAIPLTAKTVEELARNPSLDRDLGAVLAERAYDDWRTALENSTRSGANATEEPGKAEAMILHTLLRQGFPLSPSAQAQLFDIVDSPNAAVIPHTAPHRALRFLLTNPSTSEQILRALSPYLNGHMAALALAHPNCPPELWDQLANTGNLLVQALREYQFPSANVARAYACMLSRSSGWLPLLEAIVEQEHSTPEMWLEALARAGSKIRTRILIPLSLNSRARQHPEVRAALLKSTSLDVTLNLLLDQRPEEFERLMLRVYRDKPEHAVEILRHDEIPPGTPFPRKLIARLLESANGDERLLGITLLSKFEGVERAAIESPAAQPEEARTPEPVTRADSPQPRRR